MDAFMEAIGVLSTQVRIWLQHCELNARCTADQYLLCRRKLSPIAYTMRALTREELRVSKCTGNNARDRRVSNPPRMRNGQRSLVWIPGYLSSDLIRRAAVGLSQCCVTCRMLTMIALMDSGQSGRPHVPEPPQPLLIISEQPYAIGSR